MFQKAEIDGAYSDEIKPTRGFLPGCVFALACVKVKMLRRMDALVIRHPRTDFDIYVDDVEMLTASTFESVRGDSVKAVLDMADVMEQQLGHPLADDKAAVCVCHNP